MKPEEVKEFYGSQYNFGKQTGMSCATLGNWLKWGYIPEDAQYKIERITEGKLKADRAIEREMSKPDKDDKSLVDAKKFIKSHIKFLHALLLKLNGHDVELRQGAVWTAWCLHEYFTNRLMEDIEKAMKEKGATKVTMMDK